MMFSMQNCLHERVLMNITMQKLHTVTDIVPTRVLLVLLFSLTFLCSISPVLCLL